MKKKRKASPYQPDKQLKVKLLKQNKIKQNISFPQMLRQINKLSSIMNNEGNKVAQKGKKNIQKIHLKKYKTDLNERIQDCSFEKKLNKVIQELKKTVQ